jgi:hypothetical protein
MSIRMLTTTVVAILVTGIAIPGRLAAQGHDIDRAQKLEIRAEALTNSLQDLAAAARLYRRAAALRPADDGIAVRDLQISAQLSFYHRDLETARFVMLAAAERAANMGDVLRSAHAFVDAAHLASALGDRMSARLSLERARLLSASPLISTDARAHLSARISPPATVVAQRNET